MSTEQQYRSPVTKTTSAEEPEKQTAKFDLSISKIVGGALAAMTAAAIGSRLSVAGTIVGAALASIVAAVAGALYTASLKHTQNKVRTVWTGRTADADIPTTVEIRDAEHSPTSAEAPAQPSAPHWDLPKSVTPAKPRSRVSWKNIVVATLATFGIAAVSLTTFELVSGQALSGGDGTTISQAAEPQKPTQEKKPVTTTSESASPTEDPTSSATTDPQAEPSSSATEEATPEPTPEPSQTSSEPTPSATPSSEPTATVSPSTGSGG